MLIWIVIHTQSHLICFAPFSFVYLLFLILTCKQALIGQQITKVFIVTVSEVFPTASWIFNGSLWNIKVNHIMHHHTSQMLSAETPARVVVIIASASKTLWHNQICYCVGPRNQATLNDVFTTELCPCKLIYLEWQGDLLHQ